MTITIQTELNVERARIELLRRRIAAMEDVLCECFEYFKDRYDADHDGERFVANAEMRLGMMIEEVL